MSDVRSGAGSNVLSSVLFTISDSLNVGSLVSSGSEQSSSSLNLYTGIFKCLWLRPLGGGNGDRVGGNGDRVRERDEGDFGGLGGVITSCFMFSSSCIGGGGVFKGVGGGVRVDGIAWGLLLLGFALALFFLVVSNL